MVGELCTNALQKQLLRVDHCVVKGTGGRGAPQSEHRQVWRVTPALWAVGVVT